MVYYTVSSTILDIVKIYWHYVLLIYAKPFNKLTLNY